MLTALLIALLLLAALGYALAAAGDGGAILRRPYNNRYSDAAGAREDHVG